MISITKRQALNWMIVLLSLVIVFHITVVTQLIPYSIVWAGRLKTTQEMYQFEAVSLSINLFIIGVLLLKGRYINHSINDKIINTLLWLFLIIFVLNTIGNLTAETMFEKIFFTPLTLLSAILLWIILRKEKNSEPST